MKYLDRVLNKITMYRLVVYGLSAMALVGILLASVGRFAMTPYSMVASLAILLVVCLAAEWAFAKIWRQPFNSESWLITALIIFLIFPPPKQLTDVFIVAFVGIISIVSKYLVAWQGKHIFNPAALAVAVSSLAGLDTATWWVGNAAMWPLVLVVGLLIVRKIHRFSLWFAFTATAIVVQFATFAAQSSLDSIAVNSALFSSPLIFLGTIMLTEPATMPPRRYQQIIFGAVVGLLYAEAWKVGPVVIYPEIALLIGNILAFAIAPKFKMRLQLKETQKLSSNTYNYVFLPERSFDFAAGQYMEWTLPGVGFDSRGNRRTFTIASSPTEETIELGVKFYSPTSMYKYELSRMKPGDSIYASQLAGSFTLPSDQKQKLAFIAGGIGITPFRSMVGFMVDTNQEHEVKLLYVVNTPEELVYIKELRKAAGVGVKVLPVLTNTDKNKPGMVNAKLTKELIEKLVPDYQERLFYVSGPDAMVRATKTMLRELDVERHKVKTDYFSGY